MKKLLDNKIFKKIDSLEERIDKVRTDRESQREEYEGIPVEKDTPEVRLGKLAGSMFLGNIIAGLILGFVVDKYLGFAPWGMIFCIIMGFVAGIYRAQGLLKKNE